MIYFILGFMTNVTMETIMTSLTRARRQRVIVIGLCVCVCVCAVFFPGLLVKKSNTFGYYFINHLS